MNSLQLAKFQSLLRAFSFRKLKLNAKLDSALFVKRVSCAKKFG